MADQRVAQRTTAVAARQQHGRAVGRAVLGGGARHSRMQGIAPIRDQRSRIGEMDRERAVAPQWRNDRMLKRQAHLLIGVFLGRFGWRQRAMAQQRFQDRAQVEHRHLLGEQRL